MEAPIQVKDPTRKCAVDGCDGDYNSNGYCQLHTTRARRRGNPQADKPRVSIFDKVTFSSAHGRIYSLWGSASQYDCIYNCGRKAKDWSYDGTDPTELYGSVSGCPAKARYSRYPEYYLPACRPCHRKRDGAIQSAELEIFRTIMHETGLTAKEVAEKLGVSVTAVA